VASAGRATSPREFGARLRPALAGGLAPHVQEIDEVRLPDGTETSPKKVVSVQSERERGMR
jgi:hypothetical protein